MQAVLYTSVLVYRTAWCNAIKSAGVDWRVSWLNWDLARRAPRCRGFAHCCMPRWRPLDLYLSLRPPCSPPPCRTLPCTLVPWYSGDGGPARKCILQSWQPPSGESQTTNRRYAHLPFEEHYHQCWTDWSSRMCSDQETMILNYSWITSYPKAVCKLTLQFRKTITQLC